MQIAKYVLTLLTWRCLVARAAPIIAALQREQGLTVDEKGIPHVTLHPPATTYWVKRTLPGTLLYNKTLHLAMEYAPKALTVLDVGAYDPGYISQLDWIPTKVATDIQFSVKQARVWGQSKGVAFIQGDFLKLKFATKFDLVTCNQVVEHLPPGVVEPFVKKMMSVAHTLIVSTTLDLPFGLIPGHVQDPISEAKFRSWFDGPDGRIIKYATARGGNPRSNYTLPGPGHVGRVAALNQIVVWASFNPH